MKIILSRKGFDASSGWVPSLILLPDYSLCSLPIPERSARGPTRYCEIHAGDHSLGTLAADLTRGRIGPGSVAHLDPDLNPQSLPRLPNWRPVFGQAGAAEGHLQAQNVQDGDLFLFYGWFHEVEYVRRSYRYRAEASDVHVIFGWLQIERRLAVDDASILRWAGGHPHCKPTKYAALDSLYLATERLDLPGRVRNRPGGGVFSRLRPAFRLTAPGRSRSVWRLPRWFYPVRGMPSLTYHQVARRWQRKEGHVELHTLRCMPIATLLLSSAHDDEYTPAMSTQPTLIPACGIVGSCLARTVRSWRTASSSWSASQAA